LQLSIYFRNLEKLTFSAQAPKENSMKPMRRVLLAPLLLVLFACVSTKSTVLNPANQRAAISPQQVVIYRQADQVPGKYQEIAFLDSRGDSVWRSEAAMLNSMRNRAASLGANGIILDAMSEPHQATKVASALLLGWDAVGRRGKAVAIYVYPADQQPK
jgi:hypothetical protein